jgi:hypothetical protein
MSSTSTPTLAEALGLQRVPTGRPREPARVLAGLPVVMRHAPTGSRARALFWSGCRVVENTTAGSSEEAEALDGLRSVALEVGMAENEIDEALVGAMRRRTRA